MRNIIYTTEPGGTRSMSGKMIKNGLAKLLWNINKISSSEMSVIIPDCTGQLRVISTAYNRSTSRIQYIHIHVQEIHVEFTCTCVLSPTYI